MKASSPPETLNELKQVSLGIRVKSLSPDQQPGSPDPQPT